MVHTLFQTFLHRQRFVRPKDDDDDFVCRKDCGDPNGQCLARDLSDVVLKKARICEHRLVC